MSAFTSTNRIRWFSVFILMLLLLPAMPYTATQAQGNSRTFAETGKTVQGKFLDYWNTHGGLAQQGFPISNEMQEVSETDGNVYTVQYFERAVFELHPENAAPNDVLLSLLGVFFYKAKYGADGAPGQVPNNTADSVVFPQTGKRLGGTFLNYWKSHGGLAQQGFPISDEFIEISPTDGKQYRVQYFERAVFEAHPENQPPNDVLLSLLGVFRYNAKYLTPSPTPTKAAVPTATTPPAATPTTPPVPTQPGACDTDVPGAKDATITPRCGPIGTVYHITATGFTPGERISFWDTLPSGQVYGTPRPLDFGNHPGSFTDSIDTSFFDVLGDAAYGIWAATYQGEQSGHQSIVWYKVTRSGNGAPTATPVPPSGSCDLNGTKDATISPTSGRPGTVFTVNVTGFQGGETVSYWLTDPTGAVYGGRNQLQIPASGSGTFRLTTVVGMPTGRWALTNHGLSSGHESIAVFCLTP